MIPGRPCPSNLNTPVCPWSDLPTFTFPSQTIVNTFFFRELKDKQTYKCRRSVNYAL